MTAFSVIGVIALQENRVLPGRRRNALEDRQICGSVGEGVTHCTFVIVAGR